MRTISTLLAFTLAIHVSCSDDTTTPDAGVDGELVGDANVDAWAPDQGPVQDQAVASGEATDLQLGLHDNKVKIVLSTMTVVGQEATTWDLYMAHADPVDNGPSLELGAGVTAQNLGASQAFHDVDSAPTSDYEADDPAKQTYVIGSSWRGGGAGATGFIMTKNIYAIKLADGTYAKIEVLSAKSGEIHILAYRQPKAGDTDLKTMP